MRNSNSKQRPLNSQSQQQRNVKTSQTSRQTAILQNANLNNPLTVKRDKQNKQLPPKPPQKVEYKVDINMTESKIFQAKQGLQLLKKKMNRAGVSREKVYSQSNKNTQRNKQRTIITEVNSHKEEKRDISAKLNPPLTKQTMKVSHFPQQQAFEKQRPIAKQVDFMELLERQMQKQQPLQSKSNKGYSSKRNAGSQNVGQVILQTCRMGCGRNFNPETILKHQKICYKVFQSKRKAFDSAALRQPEAEGFVPVPTSISKSQPKLKPKNGIPKWKIESAQLRAGLKLAKKVPLSKEQEKALAQQDELKQCPYCGRRFNEQAAVKHIAFCQKKAKEIPKNKFMSKR